MLVLYYGSKFPFSELIPAVCFYRFADMVRPYPTGFENINKITKFIENENKNKNIEIYQVVSFFIPVPEFNGPEYIKNRYATTNVFIGWENAKTLADVTRLLDQNDKIIRWLYKKMEELQSHNLNQEAEKVLSYVQKQIWSSIEPKWKEKLVSMASTFLMKWSIEAAGQYMSPDYVWKSGEHCGKRTIDILLEKWKSQHNNLTELK